jgi:hypothetical protein
MMSETMTTSPDESLEGVCPESWECIDCGVNTAPGFLSRVELETTWRAADGDEIATLTINSQSEIYTVRDRVWQAAGMEPMGGCLCIGCLEKRLGRRLRPKDFVHDDGFNSPRLPGTTRLLQRRGHLSGAPRRIFRFPAVPPRVRREAGHVR